jgi:site-specific recombinase XerD
MLQKSYGLTFFLKSPKKKEDMLRYVHVRVTGDGVPKEISIKRKWDMARWDQKLKRATGTKEDARSFNFFLDSLVTKINQFKIDQGNQGNYISARSIIDFVKGEHQSKTKVLEEFQKHNDEMLALVQKGVQIKKEKDDGLLSANEQEIEYAPGTHKRYVTARLHIREFMLYKYKRDDFEFQELNYEFIKDYEFFLKTIRNCSNNTTLKYISNFRKIVRNAIDKGFITTDPFAQFKGKKTRIKKRALTSAELRLIENKEFTSKRLSTIRDIFVFQCYTGLAYIDIFQLKRTDIKEGIDGKLWIMNRREKSDSNTNIPLLPKALELMEKYKFDPTSISQGTVFPVKSNQKMNEYLKEIAVLSGVAAHLNTHKARHTFASTVTLGNGVPIHVVKEMLGHSTIKQTEHYTTTEEESISREMMRLTKRLSIESAKEGTGNIDLLLQKFEEELNELKNSRLSVENDGFESKLVVLKGQLNTLKEMLR